MEDPEENSDETEDPQDPDGDDDYKLPLLVYKPKPLHSCVILYTFFVAAAHA